MKTTIRELKKIIREIAEEMKESEEKDSDRKSPKPKLPKKGKHKVERKKSK